MQLDAHSLTLSGCDVGHCSSSYSSRIQDSRLLRMRSSNALHTTLYIYCCLPRQVGFFQFIRTASTDGRLSYHENRGGPGVNLETGAHAPNPFTYDGSNKAVFATEYNWKTNIFRKLNPKSNTFCSAGAFLSTAKPSECGGGLYLSRESGCGLGLPTR